MDGTDGVGLSLLWGASLLFVALATIALRQRDVVG
jgi:hypothetical protein